MQRFAAIKYCSLLWLLLLVLLGLSGCRLEKQLAGQVVDFSTGLPLADARLTVLQSGWGVSNGSLVWDKTYQTTAYSDRQGNFRIRYRVGGSANLKVTLDGYLDYRAWYPANSRVRLRLKPEIPNERTLPNGYLRLGQRSDGRYYGWNFRQAKRVFAVEQADLFLTGISLARDKTLQLSAPPPGGLRFIPQPQLGVDSQYLLYTDQAAEDGYLNQLTIDFSGNGGILFVRCRDGQTYAKIEIDPRAYASTGSGDENQDLTLRYVYNPSGGRNLLYQGEGPNLPFPEPAF